MNQDINPLELVIRDIAPSQLPAIVLPANPSVDAVSAALVLYFGLGKQGKQAIVACPTPVTYDIPGVEHIKSTLSGGGRNLVISFPYTDGSIDKVDYRIENSAFNLIVIPREGFEKVTPDQINFSYQGGQPDTFVTVGAGNLQSLGKMYQDNQQILDTLPLVVVNRQQPAVAFGSSEYTRETSYLTELACELLGHLEIQLDQNIATVAFAGISNITNNFTNENTSAEAFELAGKLMRLGAKKMAPVPAKPQTTAGNQATTSQAQSGQSRKWMDNRPKNTQPQTQKPKANVETRPNQNQYSKPQNNSVAQGPQKPVRPERFSTNPAIPKVDSDNFRGERENLDIDSTQESVAENATSATNRQNPANGNGQVNQTPQEDWLKPKIFKGGGFI